MFVEYEKKFTKTILNGSGKRNIIIIRVIGTYKKNRRTL